MDVQVDDTCREAGTCDVEEEVDSSDDVCGVLEEEEDTVLS
jgi:hypothetical protein